MYVQLICKERTEDQMNELYEVLAALCHREGVQIEDRGSHVEVLVCPQGKIIVTEDGKDMILSANTRHGGPGFHAFVVDLFKDLQEEVPGDYEMTDDLEYDQDEDFDRLHHAYEHELDYVRDLILNQPGFRDKNYLFDETYYLPIPQKGTIHTSTGPMTLRDFEDMHTHDLMDRFYVWNNWERDARFYRNAALTLLAKEGHGIYSMMNDETEKTANEIMDYLEIAHREDPKMPLPLKEYEQLAQVLGRENKLKDAADSGQEALQYRTREVYHIFEDARVVAPGNAERSYDPVTRSVNLMAPYTEPGEWHWLIQASRQPDVLDDVKDVMEQDPEKTKDGDTLWMEDFIRDGMGVVDAVIEDGERRLYIHAIAQSEADIPYLKSCIEQSGFVPQE